VKPSRDPSIPHSGRVWYGGRWRKPEAIERGRIAAAKSSREKYANETPEQREARLEWSRQRTARGRHLGLTPEQAEAILARSGGACEVCGSTERLAWEHDHEAAKIVGRAASVRGRLCHDCNRALGMLGDGRPGTLDNIDALAAYVKRHDSTRLQLVGRPMFEVEA
jgi:Recombination endonuclease VII